MLFHEPSRYLGLMACVSIHEYTETSVLVLTEESLKELYEVLGVDLLLLYGNMFDTSLL